MLLIVQAVLGWGSHPFFKATVAPAGTPPEMPHRCDGVTCSIKERPYNRERLSSNEFGVTYPRTRCTQSGAVIWVRPQAKLTRVFSIGTRSSNLLMSSITRMCDRDAAANVQAR